MGLFKIPLLIPLFSLGLAWSQPPSALADSTRDCVNSALQRLVRLSSPKEDMEAVRALRTRPVSDFFTETVTHRNASGQTMSLPKVTDKEKEAFNESFDRLLDLQARYNGDPRPKIVRNWLTRKYGSPYPPLDPASVAVFTFKNDDLGGLEEDYYEDAVGDRGARGLHRLVFGRRTLGENLSLLGARAKRELLNIKGELSGPFFRYYVLYPAFLGVTGYTLSQLSSTAGNKAKEIPGQIKDLYEEHILGSKIETESGIIARINATTDLLSRTDFSGMSPAQRITAWHGFAIRYRRSYERLNALMQQRNGAVSGRGSDAEADAMSANFTTFVSDAMNNYRALDTQLTTLKKALEDKSLKQDDMARTQAQIDKTTSEEQDALQKLARQAAQWEYSQIANAEPHQAPKGADPAAGVSALAKDAGDEFIMDKLKLLAHTEYFGLFVNDFIAAQQISMNMGRTPASAPKPAPVQGPAGGTLR